MSIPQQKLVLIAAALALAACDARLVVSVTDAPVDDATTVTVQFTGVDLEAADGSLTAFDISPARRINLLALEGGLQEELLDAGIDSGDYRAIRLRVSADGNGTDSYIDRSDGRHGLLLDAADSGGLRVSRTFSVSDRDDVAFTIDFDLRKSIHPPVNDGDPYRLVPSLRLVADGQAGAIAGLVDAASVPEGCVPAVYAWTGNNVTPDDTGSALPPVNTGRVLLNGTGEFRYRIGVLAAGAYTVALTCAAGQDQPDADDSIEFGSARNVTVVAGQDSVADF